METLQNFLKSRVMGVSVLTVVVAAGAFWLGKRYG